MKILLLVSICVGFAACEDKKAGMANAPTPPQAAPGPMAKEAAEIFNARCTMCHGAAGKGDGAAAQALNPKPRDMSDGAWQKSVTDEHLKKVIVEGGAAAGKSNLMPANPDLKDKPDVVNELVKKVRSLSR